MEYVVILLLNFQIMNSILSNNYLIRPGKIEKYPVNFKCYNY